MKKKLLFIGIICFICTLSTWAGGGTQQVQGDPVWPPTKNVEILTSAGPGSGTDAVIRTAAAYLTKKLGVSFYVTNDNSGGGTVAYERMRNGPTDGSVFLFIATTMILQSNTGIYNRNVVDDFTIITDFQVPVEQSMIVVKADSKYKTLKDLVDDAKARPNMVSVGVGSMSTVYAKAVAMEQVFGVTFRKVDGNDNAERIAGILGGYTDFMVVGAASIDSYVQSGDMRYLGYFWNEPSDIRPDVPTVKDFGYTVPSKDLFSGHYPILGPKGMDERVANAIAEALKGLEEDQHTRDTLWNLEKGYPLYTPREEGINLVKSIDAFAKVVAASATK